MIAFVTEKSIEWVQFKSQAAQAYVSERSQQLIHDSVTRCVTRLREEPLKIWARYKE